MSFIGQLDHRLVIEKPLRTSDAAGGAQDGWQLHGNVWAHMRPLLQGERLYGDAVDGFATHIITIRHKDDITADMRFRFDTRIFDIVSLINDNENNSWTICKCRENSL